jgi:CDP-diacylglycerol--serine O-phosphatidyltransferase
VRKIAILPTMCTLGNATCGFTAIALVTNTSVGKLFESVELAAYLSGWLIFAAMVFDMLDGYVARRSKTASQFGAELDSLCDAISFGVAPAFLLIHLGSSKAEVQLSQHLYFGVAILFVWCVVLRLARFNVQTTIDEKSHRFFKGLPSPGGAGCIASLVLLRHASQVQGVNATLLRWIPEESMAMTITALAPFLGALVALLMVSRFQYVHLTNRILRRPQRFGRLIQVVLALFLVILFRELALVLGFWGYACSGPLKRAAKEVNPQPVPLPPPPENPEPEPKP